MLPDNFAHRELFDAIVVGVILLSTIIYAFTLVFIITLNKVKFTKEYEKEVH